MQRVAARRTCVLADSLGGRVCVFVLFLACFSFFVFGRSASNNKFTLSTL